MSPKKESSDNLGGFLFISTLSSNVPTDGNTWLIDSGASHHITRYREHLSDLVDRETNLQVIIGDDASYSVKCVGDTSLQLDYGIPFHLSEVLFVPGIKRNLVSISALEDKGYQVAFSEGKVLAWSKNSSIKSARVIDVHQESRHKLFLRPIQALVHDSINSSELWHMRLGHLHFKALPSLEKMIIGLSKLSQENNGICKGCALGKNVKSFFLSSESRSKGILDLIHFDLCGPMFVASLSGCWYYIIFIDDYSRKTWIYFLII